MAAFERDALIFLDAGPKGAVPAMIARENRSRAVILRTLIGIDFANDRNHYRMRSGYDRLRYRYL